MRKKYLKIAGLSALVLLIFVLTALSFRGQDRNSGAKGHAEEATQYVCSMHPQVIRDIPGDCPICGMFLIELIALDDNKYDSSLTDIVRPVNKSVLAAVRTVIPEQLSLPVVIEASGVVNYDPRKVQTISARFGGVIEKSFVRYQFQYIRKGDKIFEIFAPNIYDDRWNYVRLIQTYPDREDLTVEALEWFRLIGLSKGQIDTLKKTIRPEYNFAVYSPAEGYAVSLDFNPGTFFPGDEKESGSGDLSQVYGGVGLTDGKSVGTGDPLFRLADVRALQVELKVKTQEGSLLRRGQKVTVSDPVFPERNLTGDIDQVEPLSGGIFQSVRIYIRDEGRILSPGRQVQASIAIGERDGLWVPVSAVGNLGTRRTVMVRNDNKFIPVEVATGVEAGGRIEILSGIDARSEIAAEPLLLIDSDGLISPRQEVTGEKVMFAGKSGQEEMTSGTLAVAASMTSVVSGEAAPPASHIMMSEAQLQLANISTAVARTGIIGQELSLTAVLKVNEQSAATVSSRVPGRIEKLYFKNTGETVKKGDKLYEFFSEELITLQREYMRLESNNWNFSARYEPSLAVREKLQRMGMTELQIRQLAADSKVLFTLPIYSPVSGKIRSVNVSEGEYVKDGQVLFNLADDINLWVEALAYPYDTRFIRPGMDAEVLIPSAGKAPINCKIDFVNPSLENGKNISLVRVLIYNPGRTLHPGMLAILKVRAETSHGVVIPASAVMRNSGGERVWVREACGGFSVRPVISGMQAGDSILIVSGLKEAEVVAASGVYLLDSEQILKQGPEMPGKTEVVKTTVAGFN